MANLGHTEFRKAPKWSKHADADGVAISPGPFVGIVKANTDPMYSGKLQVWIPELGGDPADDKSWRTVSYCTPFYGVTNHRDSNGYAGSPHSYGMWFVPPDIGVKVLCTFANGDPARGFWFGCIPEWPSLHMVPGISSPIDGSSPAPVVDYFDDRSSPGDLANAPTLKKLPHDVQQQIWTQQGLLQDPDRGPGTSSAFRETPSAVFGISTPGQPIDPNDPQQFSDPENPDNTILGVKGRKGGHTFIMDDGDHQGKNQMMRLRTSGGHMIMMNDTKDFIYVINSKGTSWIEINSQGDINVYSGSTVNLSAQSGINLETKGDIKLHAGDSQKGTGDIHIKAESNINLEAKNINMLASGSTKVTGKQSLHLKGMNTYLTGDSCIQIKADGHIDLKGACHTINTADATKATEATGAQTPTSMPTKESWTGHQSAANPKAQPTYGATQNLPSGAAGPYGATNNFGSGSAVQPTYGAMTNNIPPITYNSGPQGSFAGQSSIAAQYVPDNYNNNGLSYTVLSNIQNITYGTGAYFDVSNAGQSTQKQQYSVGEMQNNPGNLQYSTTDKFAVGFANNLAVYTKPESGIAALMTLFDSYQSNNTLTCAQLLQKYLQSSNINDNRVVSMARFVQSNIGINSGDFVSLTDPTTRIGWASTIIQFVQNRIIYTYNQVLGGCALSIGVDPTTFAAKAQLVTKPWQNSGGTNPNSGFVNPAKNNGVSNNGNSPLTSIATSIINNVISGVVNNVVGSVSYAVGSAVGNTVNTFVSGAANPNNSGNSINGGLAYSQYIGQSVGSGQCVALVQAASSCGNTSTWQPGTSVTDGNLQPGTVIATFGSNGIYQNISGQSHAAIFLDYQRDSNGNITGIQVQDQWAGSACGVRTIPYGTGTAESGENFHAVTNDGSTAILANGTPTPVNYVPSTTNENAPTSSNNAYNYDSGTGDTRDLNSGQVPLPPSNPATISANAPTANPYGVPPSLNAGTPAADASTTVGSSSLLDKTGPNNNVDQGLPATGDQTNVPNSVDTSYLPINGTNQVSSSVNNSDTSRNIDYNSTYANQIPTPSNSISSPDAATGFTNLAPPTNPTVVNPSVQNPGDYATGGFGTGSNNNVESIIAQPSNTQQTATQTDNSYLPIENPAPSAGGGSAVSGGAQNTPQGTAATNMAGKSC